MKLAHRQKFSGKARTTFMRDRQERWWTEECVEDFLDPHDRGSAIGEHVAPVIRGAAILAQTSALDRSGEYAALESVSTGKEAFSFRPLVEAAKPAPSAAPVQEPAPAATASAPSVLRPASALNLLPEQAPRSFSWEKFALGCVIGTAAALGVLVVLGAVSAG